MREAWILLGLAMELRLLTTYGFNLKAPAAALALLVPVALLFVLERLPVLRGGWPLKVAGLLAFHAALFFARIQVLRPFDAKDLGTALLLATTLVGAAWVARSVRPAPVTAWGALWMGAWLLTALLDPVLPLLGLGVTALVVAFGRWPEATEAAPRPAFLPWFLLGLVILKPSWDHGLDSAAAWSLGAFGLGWALTRGAGLGVRLGRRGLLTALGLLGMLYVPSALAPWGLLLGLAWGWLQTLAPRETEPTPGMRVPAGALLAGVVLSFALHANAWLPGLRHLIWLGN